MTDTAQPKFVFFGGEPLGVPALAALKKAGLMPTLVVCSPDRPVGRGYTLTPPPVKEWAIAHGIEVWQPEGYRGKFEEAARAKLAPHEWDLFVVVAYNFILPQWLIEIPKHNTLNVHPSLLPKLRGPSPIRTAILENVKDAVGVSIMLLDDHMDHGPLLAQEPILITDDQWPLRGPELDTLLAETGGRLLAKTIPHWLAGNITPKEQAHEHATYTEKFSKADFEVSLDPHALPHGDEAKLVLQKINAFLGIGDAFFLHNSIRVKLKKATLSPTDELQLLRVTPAGKSEMDFAQFLQQIS